MTDSLTYFRLLVPRAMSLAVLIFACGMSSALTPAEVERDVSLAREAFERVHPGYDRYTPATELALAWQAVIDDARAASGMTDAQFYLRLQAVLAQIRCDHTKAELPPAVAKARRTDPVYLPLLFELVEGRAIVVAVAADIGDGIEVGDEILAIDGRSIDSLVEQFGPLIPVDGFTDHVKRHELAWSLEFDGGAIEHFMALEGVPPTAVLKLAAGNAAPRDVSVARIGLTAQRALLSRASNFADAVSLEQVDPNTAILSVDTFINYRKPVDPDDVYAPLFASLKEKGIAHLIVDLRRNGGGSDDARNRLLAHLIKKRTTIAAEVQVKTLDLDGLREHLSTWDSRALNPRRWWFSRAENGRYRLRTWLFGAGGRMRPARNAFDGRVTLLSSGANSSGTTMLMAALQATGRAQIVGEATGGNAAGPTAGILFTLNLPASDIRLRLPIQRVITGYDAADSGRGVRPDREVDITVADLRAGRDAVLEAALTTR